MAIDVLLLKIDCMALFYPSRQQQMFQFLLEHTGYVTLHIIKIGRCRSTSVVVRTTYCLL